MAAMIPGDALALQAGQQIVISEFNISSVFLRSLTDSQFSSIEDISVMSSQSANTQEAAQSENQQNTLTKKATAAASAFSQSILIADASIRASLTSLASQPSLSSSAGSSGPVTAPDSKPVCEAMQKVSEFFIPSTESMSPEEEHVSCVLNILFTLVWKGIEGSDDQAWKVCIFSFQFFFFYGSVLTRVPVI